MEYKIVAGFDGSEHSLKALDKAIEFAKMVPDSEIIVVCSQDRPGPAIGFRGMDFGVEEMYDKLAEKIEEELQHAAERVRAAGVNVATACTPDRPDVTLITIAQDAGAKLIVVGTKGAGHREGQKTKLGSTVTRVLHEAEGIPVLVV